MQIRARLLSAALFGLTLLAACAGGPRPAAKSASQGPAVIARVDGAVLDAAALEAHVRQTGLQRDAAQEDLIDLMLLRAAADRAKITVAVGTWSKDERARVEYEVARAQALEVPSARETFVVDHAWLKDAKTKKARNAGRAQLEKLRALVESGKTIAAAFAELKLPGAQWHLGDHEEYPVVVVPAEVQALQAGALSPIAVGDGGIHLFKIHERRRILPEAEAVHAIVQPKLREGAKIELVAK